MNSPPDKHLPRMLIATSYENVAAAFTFIFKNSFEIKRASTAAEVEHAAAEWKPQVVIFHDVPCERYGDLLVFLCVKMSLPFLFVHSWPSLDMVTPIEHLPNVRVIPLPLTLEEAVNTVKELSGVETIL